MLFSIRDEITRAARVAQVEIEELSPERALEIREQLARKFSKDIGFELNCNNLVDYSAVHDPDGWSWVGDFVGQERALFFYDSTHDTKRNPDRSMFVLPSGAALLKVLQECYGFVFYVTNEDLDYILCHNSHDVLMGAGTAKAWTDSLARGHRRYVRPTDDK